MADGAGPTQHPKSLVQAVLAQALQDLRDYRRERPGGPRLRALEAWFKSDDPGPFRFAWCCDALGLDREAVRKVVLDPNWRATCNAR